MRSLKITEFGRCLRRKLSRRIFRAYQSRNTFELRRGGDCANFPHRGMKRSFKRDYTLTVYRKRLIALSDIVDFQNRRRFSGPPLCSRLGEFSLGRSKRSFGSCGGGPSGGDQCPANTNDLYHQAIRVIPSHRFRPLQIHSVRRQCMDGQGAVKQIG